MYSYTLFYFRICIIIYDNDIRYTITTRFVYKRLHPQFTVNYKIQPLICVQSIIKSNTQCVRVQIMCTENFFIYLQYAPLAERVRFMAVGLKTLGAFGPSTLQLFEAIASRVRTRTGKQGIRARLLRLLAAAIQIGHAACIVEAHTPTLPQLGQEL